MFTSSFIYPILLYTPSKGFNFPEGDITDLSVYEGVSDVHDLYADWIFLYSKKYIVTSSFNVGEKSFPLPDANVNRLSNNDEIPIKALFPTKNDKNNLFSVAKMQVEEYISKNWKVSNEDKPTSVPDIDNILDQLETSISIENFEKLFLDSKLSIFFYYL